MDAACDSVEENITNFPESHDESNRVCPLGEGVANRA